MSIKAYEFYEKDAAFSHIKSAQLAAKENDTEKAADEYEAALRYYEKHFSPTSPQILGIKNNLAQAYNAHGDRDNALRVFTDALKPVQKVTEENRKEVGALLDNSGKLLVDRGKVEAGIQLYQWALTVFEKGSKEYKRTEARIAKALLRETE